MGLFDTVVTNKPRPLPVFLLVDVSDSMKTNGKIAVCNQSVGQMISGLQQLSDSVGQIQLCVITFGGSAAQVHTPLQPVSGLRWSDMGTTGLTPLGSALRLAAGMIEDPDVVPHRSYIPHVIVVSDGAPNDDWQAALSELNAGQRSGRAIRLAVAIQSEPGDKTYEVLRTVAGDASRVRTAEDAHAIADALDWVTLSVAAWARSQDPNASALPPKPDLDDL